MENDIIYFDVNATTPLAPEVIQEICYSLTNLWGNPSSSYDIGVAAKAAIEKARSQVANMIRVPANDIIFTSGGTEANNMVLCGLAKPQPDTGALPHFVTSTIEHDSVLQLLRHLEAEQRIELSVIGIDPETGLVDLELLEQSLRPDTRLVSIMLASNETGVIQPLRDISKLVRLYSNRNQLTRRILLHSDAAQAFGKVSVSADDLGVDYLTIVGHKFYGPRVGALYVRNLLLEDAEAAPINPLMIGGGQERGLRSGTENTALLVGLGKAAQLVTDNVDQYNSHMTRMCGLLESRFEREFTQFGCKVLSRFPGIDRRHRLPNTCCVAVCPDLDITGPQLLDQCPRLRSSVGSACHSALYRYRTGYTGSAVLAACGFLERLRRSAIRLSIGRDTTENDVKHAVLELRCALDKCVLINGQDALDQRVPINGRNVLDHCAPINGRDALDQRVPINGCDALDQRIPINGCDALDQRVPINGRNALDHCAPLNDRAEKCT